MNSIFLKLRLLLSLVGVVLAFASAKYMTLGLAKKLTMGAGVSLLTAACLIAWILNRKALKANQQGEAKTWMMSLCWQCQWLLGVILYNCYVWSLGASASPETFLQKILLASWVFLAVTGTFMGLGVESAKAESGSGEFSEPERVRKSMMGWLRVGLIGIIVAAVQYVAVKKNFSKDLSYLKTTRVSESTLAAAEVSPVAVEVSLFYPAGNEVLSQIKPYFDELRSAKNIVVSERDVELDPVAAEKWKTGKNGVIVLNSSAGMERVETGLTLSNAKKTLKNLDGEFQRALVSATRKRKTLYFTRGHSELDWMGGDDVHPLQSIKLVDTVLRDLNFNQKFFGFNEGSGSEVPSEADAVVIVGSRQDFLAEEVNALSQYVEKGGRVFVLLDVDKQTDAVGPGASRDVSKDPLVKWLKQIGISFETGVLANDRAYVAATRSDADHWFLGTNIFTSHESVATLAKLDQKANVLSFRSGWLEIKKVSGPWNVYETVRTLSDTFVDENRDFKFSSGKETRGAKVIGAVAVLNEKPDSQSGRVAVFADASAITDALVRNQANLIYFVDTLRWLAGESKIAGVPASEEDVKIRHTNREDLVWFYVTVVAVPAVVILVGALIRRSQRRRVVK
jgi:hypothetical protein